MKIHSSIGLRGLIALRKKNDVFDTQGMEFLFRENKGLFAILRGSRTDGVICVHNLTNTPQPLDLSGFNARTFTQSANQPAVNINEEDSTLLLEPYAYIWFDISG